MDVQDWCSSDCEYRGRKYSLFGAVFHTGGSSFGGHYTAYVRSSELMDDEPMWIHYDDDTIKRVSQRTLAFKFYPLAITSTNAYMLFFQMVQS